MARFFWPKKVFIRDGDDQARSSRFDGQKFFLRKGAETTVDNETALALDNKRASFFNFGDIATTGEASTVALESNKNFLLNFHSGTISADDTAVEVSGRNARIVNAGQIDGGVNGVDFANGGESSGALLNIGRIQSDSRAVNIGGNGVSIHNFGKIEGTGDQRNGTIYSDGSAENFNIFNYAGAEIDAGEGNNGAGISLQIGDEDGDVVQASVINDGTIRGRSDQQSGGNLVGDGIRVFSGVSTGVTTFDGDIVNTGTVIAEDGTAPGDGSVADGIEIRDVVFNGDVINAGEIIADADGIDSESAGFTGNIINSGTIEGAC